MREYFDDVDDIELDDNEIIDRLMRKWAMEERRKVKATRRGARPKRSRSFDDDGDAFEGDPGDGLDDYAFEDEDGGDFGDDY
jgi:hypothetical protein